MYVKVAGQESQFGVKSDVVTLYLLCRLTYFQYTGAISEWNTDKCLQVCNDEIRAHTVCY